MISDCYYKKLFAAKSHPISFFIILQTKIFSQKPKNNKNIFALPLYYIRILRSFLYEMELTCYPRKMRIALSLFVKVLTVQISYVYLLCDSEIVILQNFISKKELALTLLMLYNYYNEFHFFIHDYHEIIEDFMCQFQRQYVNWKKL